MIFQEPKVEFVKMLLNDTIMTTSGGGSGAVIGNCTGNDSDEDCSGGAISNY